MTLMTFQLNNNRFFPKTTLFVVSYLFKIDRYSPVNDDSSDSDDNSESTPFAKHDRVHLYQQPEEDDELCK